MDEIFNFYFFLAIIIGGVIFERALQILYFRLQNRKQYNEKFSAKRYLYYLSLPFISVIFMSVKEGEKILEIFLAFAILGPIIEYLIGYFYHQIVGSRLWTYHSFAISGYTSWLSLPIWGLAGVLFWFLAQIFV